MERNEDTRKILTPLVKKIIKRRTTENSLEPTSCPEVCHDFEEIATENNWHISKDAKSELKNLLKTSTQMHDEGPHSKHPNHSKKKHRKRT